MTTTTSFARVGTWMAVVVVIGFFLALPLGGFAQTTTPPAESVDSAYTFVPLTQLPGLDLITQSPNSFSGFLNQIYKILIGVGAVAAVVMIMYAGVQIMISSGSVRTNEAAKSRITNAVLGLVLILSPVIVFGIINPDILNLEFDFTKLESNYQQIDVGGIYGSLQQQRQCTAVESTQVVTLVEGKDNLNACTAIGKGWAGMDTACCSARGQKVGSGQQCCGYSKSNDQNTPAPTRPEERPGNFSFDWAMRVQDYSEEDGGYCLMETTERYEDQKQCVAAYERFVSATKEPFTASNNCSGTLGQVVTRNGFTPQMNRFHACEK
jgi:hypothetical protein